MKIIYCTSISRPCTWHPFVSPIMILPVLLNAWYRYLALKECDIVLFKLANEDTVQKVNLKWKTWKKWQRKNFSNSARQIWVHKQRMMFETNLRTSLITRTSPWIWKARKVHCIYHSRNWLWNNCYMLLGVMLRIWKINIDIQPAQCLSCGIKYLSF